MVYTQCCAQFLHFSLIGALFGGPSVKTETVFFKDPLLVDPEN